MCLRKVKKLSFSLSLVVLFICLQPASIFFCDYVKDYANHQDGYLWNYNLKKEEIQDSLIKAVYSNNFYVSHNAYNPQTKTITLDLIYTDFDEDVKIYIAVDKTKASFKDTTGRIFSVKKTDLPDENSSYIQQKNEAIYVLTIPQKVIESNDNKVEINLNANTRENDSVTYNFLLTFQKKALEQIFELGFDSFKDSDYSLLEKKDKTIFLFKRSDPGNIKIEDVKSSDEKVLRVNSVLTDNRFNSLMARIYVHGENEGVAKIIVTLSRNNIKKNISATYKVAKELEPKFTILPFDDAVNNNNQKELSNNNVLYIFDCNLYTQLFSIHIVSGLNPTVKVTAPWLGNDLYNRTIDYTVKSSDESILYFYKHKNIPGAVIRGDGKIDVTYEFEFEGKKYLKSYILNIINFGSKKTSVVMNGNQVFSDIAPTVKDDKVLIPITMLQAGLVGYRIDWDGKKRMVTVYDAVNEKTAELFPESNQVFVNGKSIQTTGIMETVNGRTMVTPEFIQQIFNLDVKYDKSADIVFIDYKI